MTIKDAAQPSADPAAKPPSLWRNTDFTKFWFGETVSLVGAQITTLALPLTAVLVLEAGPEQLGLLRFVQFVPFLFLALLLGVWVDRRRRRPIMIATNLIRAGLILLIPAFAATDLLSMPVLFVVALLIGVCTVLFDVSWMSYVPSLVKKEHLVEANGRVGASYSAAELGGPGLAGVLIQILTAPVVLIIDAVTYLVSAVSLMTIKSVEPEPAKPTTKRHLGEEVLEGLKFVVGNPYLRVIATIGSAYNFCYMFIEAVFLIYAVRTLNFSAGMIGVVLSLSAIGGLIGSVIAGPLTRRLPIGRVYLVSVAVGYCGPLLIPAASGPDLVEALMICGAFFFMRLGIGVANVVAISLRQTVTPNRLLGRMTAAMRTLMYGLGTLGALVGGFLAGAIGLRGALWVAAVGAVLAVLPLLLSNIPALREVPPSPDDDSEQVTTAPAAEAETVVAAPAAAKVDEGQPDETTGEPRRD